MNRPTTSISPANCRCHSPSLRITSAAPPGRSSAALKTRPRAGNTPRTPKYAALTRCPCNRSGVVTPDNAGRQGLKAAQSSSAWPRVASSRNVPKVTAAGEASGDTSHTETTRSASGYGKGLSKMPCTALNIAVTAPRPMAIVTTVTTAKIGSAISRRTANRASVTTDSTAFSQPKLSTVSITPDTLPPNSKRAARIACSCVNPRASCSAADSSRKWCTSSETSR